MPARRLAIVMKRSGIRADDGQSLGNGDLNALMVLTPITGAEMAMKDLGIPIELGSGVAAAQEYLRTTSKDVRVPACTLRVQP